MNYGYLFMAQKRLQNGNSNNDRKKGNFITKLLNKINIKKKKNKESHKTDTNTTPEAPKETVVKEENIEEIFDKSVNTADMFNEENINPENEEQKKQSKSKTIKILLLVMFVIFAFMFDRFYPVKKSTNANLQQIQSNEQKSNISKKIDTKIQKNNTKDLDNMDKDSNKPDTGKKPNNATTPVASNDKNSTAKVLDKEALFKKRCYSVGLKYVPLIGFNKKIYIKNAPYHLGDKLMIPELDSKNPVIIDSIKYTAPKDLMVNLKTEDGNVCSLYTNVLNNFDVNIFFDAIDVTEKNTNVKKTFLSGSVFSFDIKFLGTVKNQIAKFKTPGGEFNITK